VITLVLHVFRLLPFLVGGHRQFALENLALRQKLAVYKRLSPRPKLRTAHRLFWAGLARAWTGWRQALVIVSPDTVLRWQLRRFLEYWTRLSRRPTGGRPSLDAEIAALIRKMTAANPLWGAPRIHGELLKLGIDIAERTVSRLMPKRRPQPSQTWRAFLANHVGDLVSIDFFTVPTVRLRVLFVLVVRAHHRRRVVHFNITEHPTAAWTAQQLVEAFPDDSAPSYLVRDRDQVYGQQSRHRMKGLGIEEVLMPKHRPRPSQTWRTFLANHVCDLVSLDFFTVPTAGLRVLFVPVVLAHHRRRVVHFNVTAHPTAHWASQQIVDAFPDDSAPAYLLRDRDSIYGHPFRRRVKAW
jgi:hypothetical protein